MTMSLEEASEMLTEYAIDCYLTMLNLEFNPDHTAE